MGEKVLVRVSVPVIRISFDARIPRVLTCAQVAAMLKTACQQIYGDFIPMKKEPQLWIESQEKQAPAELTLLDMEIKNGDKLLLI